MLALLMADDNDTVADENKSDGALDPRKIRKRTGKNMRTSNQIKGFDDLEKSEFEKKGQGVFYTQKKDHQKELDKRAEELEMAPFDHDRKSRAKSAPIPILKEKLVPNDLHTPEIEPDMIEKTVFAKSVRGKKKNRSRIRNKNK